MEIPIPGKTVFVSLWASDIIWQQRSRSTMVPVMAWGLTAPSHYLNQCWLIIKCVLQHSHERNFPWNTHIINLQDDFENDILKMSDTSRLAYDISPVRWHPFSVLIELGVLCLERRVTRVEENVFIVGQILLRRLLGQASAMQQLTL